MSCEASTSAVASLVIDRRPPLVRVTIRRPEVRNAVDGPTSAALADAFRSFENDDELSVAILTGADGNFCAGADLKAIASGESERTNPLHPPSDDALCAGPMGPTRFRLSKPVLAAISGYCVAGGLELALWCDLRVADESAIFGVYCRRFGVPLIDGGTVRLPRAIGMSRALDMILTGRPVSAKEAFDMGLANRLVAADELMLETERLALQIAAFPQHCMRGDRRSAYEQWGLSENDAMKNEFAHGIATVSSGDTLSGAGRFARGDGRHGKLE
jgi:enoyl-CoA hydratase